MDEIFFITIFFNDYGLSCGSSRFIFTHRRVELQSGIEGKRGRGINEYIKKKEREFVLYTAVYPSVIFFSQAKL